MPVSTPNRVAQPVTLERYEPIAILRQTGGLNLPYTNITGSTIMAGEIVLCNGKACIAAGTILPGEEGRVEAEWIADVLLNPALAADILAGATVYLDYDLTATGAAAGMGAAKATAPTNGLIIGTALRMPGDTRLNGSGKPIAATTGDQRIRVEYTNQTATTYGTIPTFS